MAYEMLALGMAIIGIIFVLFEAGAPGGYMIIPGLDLIVLAVYVFFFPDLVETWVTIVIAIALTVVVVILTLMVYKRLGGTEPPSTTVAGSLVGRTGVVVVDTNSENLKGKVKIGSDTWSADSEEPLEKGTNVIVESSEGVHVRVRRL